MFGLCGRRIDEMFTKEVSELVSRAKHYKAWMCVCVCVCLWAGLRKCICMPHKVNEWNTKRKSGIKRKETRAIIPLWPWLRFHRACGVPWPCLDLVHKQWPVKTSYTPYLCTNTSSYSGNLLFLEDWRGKKILLNQAISRNTFRTGR